MCVCVCVCVCVFVYVCVCVFVVDKYMVVQEMDECAGWNFVCLRIKSGIGLF